MPIITSITTDGKKGVAVQLPESLFAAKVNAPLMAQAIRVYLSNQRQAPAKTKHRGEVSLTTRKMYRQKGTGRARHGAHSAPIFVGGGIAHGPQGNQNYQLSMPQKMRQKSLASALTSKLQAEQITVISKLDSLENKVKAAQNLLKNIKLDSQKITLVLPSKVPALVKTWRNLSNVTVTYANLLNTFEVLNGGMILFADEAINVMEQTYAAVAKNKNTTPITKPEIKKAVAETASTAKKAATNKVASSKTASKSKTPSKAKKTTKATKK